MKAPLFVTLFAAAFLACNSDGTDDGPRRWQTVEQVTDATCRILCDWADRCDQLNGQPASECPATCQSHVCTNTDCAAEPVGSDDALDACIAGITDRTDCGLSLGLSQECQDLFITPRD